MQKVEKDWSKCTQMVYIGPMSKTLTIRQQDADRDQLDTYIEMIKREAPGMNLRANQIVCALIKDAVTRELG